MRSRLRLTALLILTLLAGEALFIGVFLLVVLVRVQAPAAVTVPVTTSAMMSPGVSVIPSVHFPKRIAIPASGLLNGEELAELFVLPEALPLPPPPAAVAAPVVLPPPPEKPLELALLSEVPELRPSLFEGVQVVSFYGYPGFPVMGALGAYDPDGAIVEVARVAAEYDAANGDYAVLPALHLIVAVAQRLPGSDGLYLERIADHQLESYIEAARRHDVLLFLDIQVGWSEVLLEVERLEHALREPFVHLALDPEFATRERQLAPGVAIGSLDATQVNQVQAYLGHLVRTFDLPPKSLVLHQFLDEMLVETDSYDNVPEVELTIDMDGFGSDTAKLSKYERFALSSYAERAAIKLFYDWDVPLISPTRLLALDNPPDLIIYQ